MRNTILSGLIFILATAGCITVDMGGGTSSRAPNIIKFEVSPSSISSGGAAILAWEVENASSISIDPGIPVAPSTGADKVAPATTTTYVLTASNKYGSTRSTVLLMVGATGGIPQIPASGTPLITSFYSSPSSIGAGSVSVLAWSTTNATGAKISGIGNVATSGSQTVYPSSTTTYILEATNGMNSASASTMVAVTSLATPPPASLSLPVILSFTASPASVTSGGSTVLSWNVANATSVNIAGIGLVQPLGSRTIYPSGTGSITFSLTATNSAGSSYANTTITVGSAPAPPLPLMPVYRWPTISDFHCSHTSVPAGNQAKLYWTVTDADTITIDNGIGSVAASGTVYIYPTSTTIYTLMASNGGNTVAQSVTVNVTP